jgi:hypothetical protein
LLLGDHSIIIDTNNISVHFLGTNAKRLAIERSTDNLGSSVSLQAVLQGWFVQVNSLPQSHLHFEE